MSTSETAHQKLFDENVAILNYLRESRLFGFLPEETLQKLVPLSDIKHIPEGTDILVEGQLNDRVYFLIRGTVAVYAGGELILKLRRIGDIFGEMSIISNQTTSATCKADTDVNLFSLRSRDVGQYTDLNAEDLQNILYRLFAKILTEKLNMTTHKAKQFEATNRRLEQTLQELQEEVQERKRAEEKIRRFNEDLISAHNDLKNTQTQLVQAAKLASLGEMAMGIAHEVNQPLTSIRLKAEGLLHDWKHGLQIDPNKKVKKIIQLVDRIATITSHLRSFGRKSTAEYKYASIHTIIEEAFLLFNEQLPVRGIQIHQDIAKDLPEVLCNSIQLEQVLTNLIGNARDALESTPTKQLTVRAYQQEDCVFIEIEDNGIGISEENLPKVFDPFFTTKEVGEGTGLGLSISYNIIQEHRGRLSVESQEGHGSTFKMELPLSQPPKK